MCRARRPNMSGLFKILRPFRNSLHCTCTAPLAPHLSSTLTYWRCKTDFAKSRGNTKDAWFIASTLDYGPIVSRSGCYFSEDSRDEEMIAADGARAISSNLHLFLF